MLNLYLRSVTARACARVAGLVALVASASLLSPCVSEAGTFVTFAGSGTLNTTGDISASAKFAFDGNHTLTVTLTNTSSTTSTDGAAVLTEVFFNTKSASDNLTPSAGAPPTASGIIGKLPNGESIGSNWAYETKFASAWAAGGNNVNDPSGNHLNSVISTTGLNIDGLGNVSGLPYFASPTDAPLGGPGFGIVSNHYGSNAGGFKVLAQNSITFTLTTGAGFSLTDIGTVAAFQFGTSSGEPFFTGKPPGQGTDTVPAPEPGAMAIWGALSLAGVVFGRRRKLA